MPGMQRTVRRFVLVLFAAVVALVAVTWWALESGDVAVVETAMESAATTGGADLRRTHVWFVVAGDDVLIEAGTPDNGWYVDARRTGRLRIVEPAQIARDCRTEVLANPDGHERIRSLLRQKYGLRDLWIATIFDTSRSLAVRCGHAAAPF